MSEEKIETKNQKRLIKIILPIFLIAILIGGLIWWLSWETPDVLIHELHENIYKIETDMRWLTMMNDGGSNTNEVYYVDFGTNIISKIWEHYEADLRYGKPETSQNILYEKELTPDIAGELKILINNVLEKEDINEPKNYRPFTISTKDKEKTIYNEETIKEIKDFLRRIDEM